MADLRSVVSRKSVEVVEYDATWPASFDMLRNEFDAVLGAAAARVHHVGSTSVPGLRAKPIIDVLIEASDLRLIEDLTPELEKLGYRARGEHGLPGRRYFSRPVMAAKPPVHLHIYAAGDPRGSRHLHVREFLRQHPLEARAYSNLKSRLAVAHPHDREAYQGGKADLLDALEKRAAAWSSGLAVPGPAG